ncbi:MAG: ADP-ribosylglycohydrolase family protein [Anaerolineae bacterium]|nr:ADP-ribosylglycohydrolase family protein [Anaerolineae bacterium]
MITRNQLVNDREKCRDKALGCLGGLAVGDTLGELARSDVYRERYGVISDLYGNTQSTDDTEFAVLTAKIVLASGGHLTDEIVHAHWMQHIVEEGIQSRSGLVSLGARANLQRGMRAPLSGQDNCHNYDDGVAMRIAPVGIAWAGDPKQAAAMAEVDGRISHDRDGIWAGNAVAASIAVAMADGTVDEVIQAGLDEIPDDSWLGRAVATALCICDEEKTLESSWERLHDELWQPYRAAAPEAIAQTYGLLRLVGERGFKACVVAGSNFGRDADTLGAVLGAICGAMYGASAIPDGWIEQVRQPRGVCLPFAAQYDIIDLASQLAELIR